MLRLFLIASLLVQPVGAVAAEPAGVNAAAIFAAQKALEEATARKLAAQKAREEADKKVLELEKQAEKLAEKKAAEEAKAKEAVEQKSKELAVQKAKEATEKKAAMVISKTEVEEKVIVESVSKTVVQQEAVNPVYKTDSVAEVVAAKEAVSLTTPMQYPILLKPQKEVGAEAEVAEVAPTPSPTVDVSVVPVSLTVAVSATADVSAIEVVAIEVSATLPVSETVQVSPTVGVSAIEVVAIEVSATLPVSETVQVSPTVAVVVSPTVSKAVSLTEPPVEVVEILFGEKVENRPSLALPIDRYRSVFPASYAPRGMVASENALATKVGVDILERGGNAVDAAVAVGFALAVTYPRAGNLGGGGFMLVHMGNSKETVAIDYREVAPAASTKDMFLDAAGDVDAEAARYSYNSVGVPGTVKGLLMAHEIYGNLSRQEVMAPAIRFAEEGFEVTVSLASSLKVRKKSLSRYQAAREIFFKRNEQDYEVGDTLVQQDLAWSLKEISKHGADAFYKGKVAAKIVEDMAKHHGPIVAKDLANYEAVLRKPVEGTYRGHRIVSMPPPSSGGVHLIQMLNLLERFPLGEYGPVSAKTIHILSEVMKRAYADRSKYMGDPDFVTMPLRGLMSKLYAVRQEKSISMESITPSELVSPGEKMPYESKQTTHFSVMDNKGNVVTNTYTLNFSYGTGIVASGTGILLNNEMDDFSAKPGVANAYGLLGGEANKIEAGKRPLSSMTPTLVFKNNKPILATGSPGGSQIITSVLQVISNIIDHGMSLSQATITPRVHHQWLPDELLVEEGLSPDTLELLENRGHNIFVGHAIGSMQSVAPVAGGFEGVSDPRRPGGLALGY